MDATRHTGYQALACLRGYILPGFLRTRPQLEHTFCWDVMLGEALLELIQQVLDRVEVGDCAGHSRTRYETALK